MNSAVTMGHKTRSFNALHYEHVSQTNKTLYYSSNANASCHKALFNIKSEIPHMFTDITIFTQKIHQEVCEHRAPDLFLCGS